MEEVELQNNNLTAWRTAIIAVVVVFIGLVAMFYGTVTSMVSIWWNIETYAHSFLIVPIAGWLIWGKRQHIIKLTPAPQYLALIFLVGSGFLWLLGALINADVVMHMALVSMLVFSIWAVLGNQVSLAILFPLLFLFLMVPVGEDLVPPMMEFTASFTIKLLQLTGIPVYREGLFFTIPSGNWSVVKACSGIRYLIASVTLGFVFAYLTYQSLSRRILFIVASFIVPVIANGLRAYMIVMVGHLSGMELAVGVDHLIYGWLFFGIVMFIMFAIGSRWREYEKSPDTADTPQTKPVSRGLRHNCLVASFVALSITVVWPLVGEEIQHNAELTMVKPLLMPEREKGWSPEKGSVWTWSPHYDSPDNMKHVFYRKGDSIVSVYVAQYLTQNQDSELVSVKNRLIAKDQAHWRKVKNNKRDILYNNKKMGVEESVIRDQDEVLLVWRILRIGENYTANNYVAKLLEIKSKLMFERQDAAAVVFTTKMELSADNAHDIAAKQLQKFIDEMLPTLEYSLDQVVRAE